MPAIPRGADGEPVFAAPWQAAAFAMTVALHEKGAFTWSEWAEALGREIAASGQETGADAYYQAWLAALEAIVREKRVLDADEMTERHDAWDRAARATPHGEPIVLGRERRT
jgi:nitrile hydratase accessory protein